MEVIGTGPWRVTVIESESGWGQKIDHIRRYQTEESAQEWVHSFNAKNNLPETPTWYMYAESPKYVP